MRDLVVFPGAFVAGLVAGAVLLPGVALPDLVTTGILYALMAAVGVVVGARPDALAVVRDRHVRLLAVPVLVMAGSLAAVGLVGWAWPRVGIREGLAVGAGVGYYSLTSVLASDLAGQSLGVVALLANLLREALTLTLAPILARLAGRGGPIAAGGATAMDTTLPVITRTSGEDVAVVAVASGAALTAAVPVVVTAILGL